MNLGEERGFRLELGTNIFITPFFTEMILYTKPEIYRDGLWPMNYRQDNRLTGKSHIDTFFLMKFVTSEVHNLCKAIELIQEKCILIKVRNFFFLNSGEIKTHCNEGDFQKVSLVPILTFK